MVLGVWLLWRQSEVSSAPVADRRLNEVYALEEGEVLRLVPSPGIPERIKYMLGGNPALLATAQITVRWDGRAKPWSLRANGGSIGGGLSEIGIERADYSDDALKFSRMTGDWVVRYEAPMAEKVRALESILKSSLGRTIKIERRPTEREVIVARGVFSHKPVAAAKQRPSHIHLYSDTRLDEGLWGGGGGGTFSQMLESVSNFINRPVIDESTSKPQRGITWSSYNQMKSPDKYEEALEQFLKNLAAQTSLTFTREKREVDMFFVREEK